MPARVTNPAVIRSLAGDICDEPALALRRVESVNRQIFASLGSNWDLRPTSAHVKVPLLVVEGGADTVLADAVREWAGAAPNARVLRFVEPAQPVVPWLNKRYVFDEALRTFFSGGWPEHSEQVVHVAAN